MIKLFLVDDHTLMRDGITSMLADCEDIKVVGSSPTGEEAINKIQELQPDVVLMDIMLRGMTGIEATRWIKEQDKNVKVILVSMEVKKEFLSAGIQCGINGYIPKDTDKETMIHAIRTVYGGERYFTDAITKLVFEDFYVHEKLKNPETTRLPNDLTKREYEVLGLVAMGKGNKEIAELLFISVKTVETHKGHILEKLGLKNSAELIKYAIKNNIVPA
ncbi:response regulator transcription factor [Chryseolinea sp. H1M3-3]|uniref:response regulator transcription factor n=1 Tax=Chryseolinea sp. H1M3-3 TaxID=3034144 RepID=UPI0023EC64B6|nr:response regulator transcription factor [Chryseolinea sp. H1M3-3]